MHSTAKRGIMSTPICQRCGPSSSSSGGGADGEPSHVCLSFGGVPPGGSGALFLTLSGTALTGVLLGTDID